MNLAIIAVLSTLSLACTAAVVPSTTFGTTHKACYRAPGKSFKQSDCVPWPTNRELPVFSHACGGGGGGSSSSNGGRADDDTGCVMAHMWTGGGWPSY